MDSHTIRSVPLRSAAAFEAARAPEVTENAYCAAIARVFQSALADASNTELHHLSDMRAIEIDEWRSKTKQHADDSPFQNEPLDYRNLPPGARNPPSPDFIAQWGGAETLEKLVRRDGQGQGAPDAKTESVMLGAVSSYIEKRQGDQQGQVADDEDCDVRSTRAQAEAQGHGSAVGGDDHWAS
ncbi:hypothetical protein LTR53_018098 [Teratosphaeriaceae sp. CCFEE 6253]|nr:hypothetical protein LTR53_018098 [Teratosphaeriaceae sp. CCFEE 6253]